MLIVASGNRGKSAVLTFLPHVRAVFLRAPLSPDSSQMEYLPG